MTIALDPVQGVAAAIRQQLAAPTINPYLGDPVGWVRDRRGVHLWSKQREIAESLIVNKRTAVKSCHNAGKSFIAAQLAGYWTDVHPPGEAFIVSTAPSYPQVHAILWEEIRRAAKNPGGTPLPGRVLQSDEWKLDDGTLVGWGRKPADTDQHGFQGIHRKYVLVIIDEACGIPEQLWTAVEAITTTDTCRILAIGNPDDPNTEFGNVCKPGSGWNVIRISGFDTPNFTGERVPAAVADLMLSPEWVEDKRLRWGETSPRYTAKVLGEFPELGDDTLISPRWIEAAQARTLDPGPHTVLGVDVARFGSDSTIFALARGPVVRVVAEHSKLRTTETTGHVIAAKREHKAHEVRVDGVGVGAGVVDELLEHGHDVVDMQSGARALDREHFANARAEWWWGLRERFEQGDIDLDPGDEELAAQLGAMKYTYTSRGQVLVESKDDMRKRGIPSPDRADAVMLAKAFLPPPDEIVEPDDLDDEIDDRPISLY
ncbi:MAG TPA: hypothetical protein VIQ30_08335 [Pseudonocardia sp.]